MDLPVCYQDVLAAAERIGPYVRRTPLWRCRALDEAAGCEVLLKCENLQRTGAFKFRGACNAVAQLSDDEKARGVVTHSSGNHAQAVALAARLHGVQATVVMPEGASAVKRAATAGYGARIVGCEPTLAARERTCRQIIEQSGAVLIHPYDDPRVVAGQGTAALELLAEASELDAILVPVGGGGLVSGTVLACAGVAGEVAVIGCEPEGADDAYRSLRTGTRVTEQTPRTLADGLRTCLGAIAFTILTRCQVEIIRVSEDEIVRAMRFVWERAKLVIEPSSAVAVAPLLCGKTDLAGRRVAVIVSGGNVDASAYFRTLRP